MLETDATAAGPGGEGRRVAESVAALALGDLVNKAARFAAVIVLTRALPLDQYGLLNLGVALGGIAVVITRLGLPDIGARDAALAPNERERLAGRIVTPQALGFVSLTVAAALCVLVVAPSAVPFVLLSGASTLGLVISADWLLRGMERMVALALASVIGGVVTLIGAVIVAQESDSALAGLVALGIGELATAAWTWRSARLRCLPRPTLHGARGLLRESWPLALAGAITYAYYANIDTVLIAATRSAEEAGLYSAPYRLFLALNAIGVFAAYALLPVVTRALDERARNEADRIIASCLPLVAGFGLLCLAGAEMLGDRVLTTLFGAPFGAMGTTFVLLCAAVPWYAVGYPVGYAAIARGRHRRLLAGAGVAAGVNVALNAALIPPLGPEGAAIATLAAMIAAAVTWLHVQRMLERVAWLVWILGFSTLGALIATLTDAGTEVGMVTLVAGACLLASGSAAGRRILRELRPR